LVVLCAAGLGSLGLPAAARADFITDWNNQELAQIRTTSMTPLYASRDLAILQVAMFDALNGVEREDLGFYVIQDAPAGTSVGATLAAVGLRVMTSLYGSNSAFTSLYNAQIASLTDSATAINQGVTWGTSVANSILAIRGTDFASASTPAYTASGEQGEWAPTPPTFSAQPLRPGWGNVTPFALNTGSQFRPNGPPALDASAYATDFNQVKSLGQDTSSTRTLDNTNIATFWNDPVGTVTTAGHWNQALQALTATLTLHERAKAFAAVNIAMADGAITAWDAKYSYKSWRPVSAIRDEATRDTGVPYDNPSIIGDAGWSPLYATPVSPEYVSMTSTLSQAAATTLANLLGGDVHSFSIGADTNGDGTVDMTRNYTSFSQAAIEAGRAGIYGGSQFNFSIQDGRSLGESVAQYVTSNYFTPIFLPPDTGASLLSLTLSQGVLSPAFASGTASYTAVVSNDTASITVMPIAKQSQASVAVNGVTVSSGASSDPISLSLGSNFITALVTSGDGLTTTTYIVNVIRAVAPTVTSLAATNVTGTGVTLHGRVNANEVSTTVTFEYGPSTAYGSSVAAVQTPVLGSFDTQVSAALSGLASGSTYHYRVRGVSAGGTSVGDDITFTTPSTDAKLSGLLLSNGTLSPAFAAATTDYAVAVSYATASITIAPTANHPMATILVEGSPVSSGTASGAIDLAVGSNPITVLVTAEDGTTTVSYTVNVTRAAPAPEIVVEQPLGTGLTDGVSSVPFGTVNVGGGFSTLTFTIKNTGAADLTGLAITRNGTNAAEFSVGVPGSTTLAPNASTTFVVTFIPTAAGARTAAIHIASNDADENAFDINLGGIGFLAPEIAVEQPAGTGLVDNSATVDFGNTIIGIPSTRTFTIRNSGLGSLAGLGVTIDGADAGLFSVTASPAAAVASGGNTTFTVRFAPLTTGLKTAAIHVASNDADESPFDIALVGAGIPHPGVFSFNGTGFTVNETDGTVSIPIKRSGGSYGAVTVYVSTTNGTAIAPGDYAALTNVPVTFADGALSGSATVSIVNTATAEVNETFTVTLSNPTGGATLGTPGSVPVTIIDSTSLSSTTDTAAPAAPVISTPAAGALVGVNSGATVNVTGTAADNKGVKQVQVSLNGSAFTDASLGTPGAPSTTFTFQLTPVNGLNTVQVKSVDYASRVSSMVTRSFTATRPFTVNVDSSLGSVSAGFAPSSFRESGKSLSITATPKAPTTSPAFAGAIFTGWTLGGIDVTNGGIPFTPPRIGIAGSALEKPTLNFIFREGLVLTANFIVNPFVAMAGTYNGLIRHSCTLPDRAPLGGTPGPEDGTVLTNSTEGFFNATVTNTGAFSGKITMDGLVLNVAGTFDKDGFARFGTARAYSVALARVNKPSLIVALQLDMVTPGSGDKINGTVTATDFQRSVASAVSTVNAYRAFYNGTSLVVPAAYLGAANANGVFTAVFPAKGPGHQPVGFTKEDYPQGDGIGTITVSKAGVVTLTGTLADGSAVTASSTLSEAKTFPLFVPLYAKLGFLSGEVALDNTQADSDMAAADLQWMRPLNVTSHYYPSGWPEVIKVDLMAAKYAVTAGQSVLKAANGANLPAADGDGNVALCFSDGQLSEALSRTANLSTADVVTKVPDPDPSFTLTVTRATGAIGGTFTHTDDSLPSFQGIIYQKGPCAGAYGFFLTKPTVPIDYSGESGGVSLIGQP
jgi:hypothetical protein